MPLNSGPTPPLLRFVWSEESVSRDCHFHPYLPLLFVPNDTKKQGQIISQNTKMLSFFIVYPQKWTISSLFTLPITFFLSYR